MPVFIKYDGMDGQFSEADSFDFLQPTTEPEAAYKFGTVFTTKISLSETGDTLPSYDDEVLVGFEFGDVHGGAGFNGALHVAVGDVDGDVDGRDVLIWQRGSQPAVDDSGDMLIGLGGDDWY